MLRYVFDAVVWVYQGPSAWYFVTLPKDVSEEIKGVCINPLKKGFGSVRVRVVIGKSTWDTSIFPDSKSGAYFLPIKKEIRFKENINNKSVVKVVLVVEAN